jgi:NitT/TauT family transport system permease protein
VTKTAALPDTRVRSLGHAIRKKWSVLLLPVSLVVIVAAWEVASRARILPAIVFPAPTRVWEGLILLLTAEWFPQHVWVTTVETVLGFLFGSAAAILLGILMVYNRLLRSLLQPYVVAFQVMPKVVLAPLFITWFGFGIESKIVMATTIAFFPVVINTVLGLESVDENEELFMRSLVSSKRQVFLKLAWPTALPSVFAGLKTAMTLALIGALVAEFVTAKEGLGALITTFSYELKVHLVFAAIIVVSALGLALYGLMEWLDRRIVFWR